MVNPTGYTALDMIGFTDKGPYSSSANYVKNDLVHDSGNIWRCLIDDTSGIAPAEGVNWTLFIGEPTNLVERIIAPVETDPATNAWTVGRQIIYNDNLYEVIAAITAGDALVAYEDDPTNANIKLADPVETQLLDLKENISNRNLLDNAWFTVNQRGFVSTSNSGEYTVDRWRSSIASGASGTISLSNGIMTISSTSGNIYLVQRATLDDLNALIGKKLTVSLLLSDDTIISGTGVYSGGTLAYINNADVFVYTSAATGTNGLVNIQVNSGKSIAIKAIKLELGSISTLAMDTAPNYAEELLKCQRYFVRFKANRIISFTAYAQSTNVRANVFLPTAMRTLPTVTQAGTWEWILANNSSAYANTPVPTSTDNQVITLAEDGIFSSITNFEIGLLRLWNGASIDFSADL